MVACIASSSPSKGRGSTTPGKTPSKRLSAGGGRKSLGGGGSLCALLNHGSPAASSFADSLRSSAPAPAAASKIIAAENAGAPSYAAPKSGRSPRLASRTAQQIADAEPVYRGRGYAAQRAEIKKSVVGEEDWRVGKSSGAPLGDYDRSKGVTRSTANSPLKGAPIKDGKVRSTAEGCSSPQYTDGSIAMPGAEPLPDGQTAPICWARATTDDGASASGSMGPSAEAHAQALREREQKAEATRLANAARSAARPPNPAWDPSPAGEPAGGKVYARKDLPAYEALTDRDRRRRDKAYEGLVEPPSAAAVVGERGVARNPAPVRRNSFDRRPAPPPAAPTPPATAKPKTPPSKQPAPATRPTPAPPNSKSPPGRASQIPGRVSSVTATGGQIYRSAAKPRLGPKPRKDTFTVVPTGEWGKHPELGPSRVS